MAKRPRGATAFSPETDPAPRSTPHGASLTIQVRVRAPGALQKKCIPPRSARSSNVLRAKTAQACNSTARLKPVSPSRTSPLIRWVFFRWRSRVRCPRTYWSNPGGSNRSRSWTTRRTTPGSRSRSWWNGFRGDNNSFVIPGASLADYRIQVRVQPGPFRARAGLGLRRTGPERFASVVERGPSEQIDEPLVMAPLENHVRNWPNKLTR